MDIETKRRILNILQLILVACGGIMAFVQTIPADVNAPEWLREYAYLWPIIISAALTITRIISVLGDFLDDWKLNNSFK